MLKPACHSKRLPTHYHPPSCLWYHTILDFNLFPAWEDARWHPHMTLHSYEQHIATVFLLHICESPRIPRQGKG